MPSRIKAKGLSPAPGPATPVARKREKRHRAIYTFFLLVFFWLINQINRLPRRITIAASGSNAILADSPVPGTHKPYSIIRRRRCKRNERDSTLLFYMCKLKTISRARRKQNDDDDDDVVKDNYYYYYRGGVFRLSENLPRRRFFKRKKKPLVDKTVTGGNRILILMRFWHEKRTAGTRAPCGRPHGAPERGRYFTARA